MESIKLFLSHASEDQADFVRPLAEALSEGFTVWYSEYALTIGDRLLAKIDEGLRTCDYGIVVLSPYFFAKRWPLEELEGLFQLETRERKVILPIWKDLTESEVRNFSPILASRLGADAKAGIQKIVAEIRRAVGLVDRYKHISSPSWRDKFLKLDEDICHTRKIEEFSRTPGAVQIVTAAARTIIEEAWKAGGELVTKLSTLTLRLPSQAERRSPDSFSLRGPKRLSLHFNFANCFFNSLDDTELVIRILRARALVSSEDEIVTLEKYRLRPTFDKAMNVSWMSSENTFATGDSVIDFAFDRFVAALANEN